MKHFKRILAFVCIFILAISVSVSALAANTGTYNTAAVHLRSSPNGSSYGLVSKGTTCEIIAEQGEWLQVEITSHTKNTPDLYGYIGWSKETYIDRDGSTGGGGNSGNNGSGSNLTYDDIHASGSPIYGTVNLNSGYLKVRALPSTNSNEVDRLYDGDFVVYYPDKLDSVGSDSYKWYKLTSPCRGFVATNYISANGTSSNDTCSTCGSKMTYKTYEDIIVDTGKATMEPDGRIWYPATAIPRYSCPTHSGNYYEGNRVSGRVYSPAVNNFIAD